MSDGNKISFQNILVPVDGSHPSLHAEELAALIAKVFDSRVTVLHVIPSGSSIPRFALYVYHNLQ